MSKSKTTGSAKKIFDTHDDKIKNNVERVLETANFGPVDLDEEEIKKIVEDINKQ